ncbi:MAG: hypothetical protein ABIH37_05180 [archaeon]
MITYSNYKYQKVITSVNENPPIIRGYSELLAQLRFGKQTSRWRRREVKKRCSVRGVELRDYLRVAENLLPDSKFYKSFQGEGEKRLIVYPPIFALGIDISIISEGEINPLDLIDLQALDNFILTGKIDSQA